MTLAPWNEDAWRNVQRRRAQDRLPHALLLAGPAGLGKRDFATAFARGLLCEAPDAGGRACGVCRACRLLAAGTHPDCVAVGLETRDDGKLRSEITVEQMRRLGERLALTAQFGQTQIALIDPADAMNHAAANALLKTLEEPTSGTIIVLVADFPARLPATIRSRCQRIDFRAPPLAQAQDWLVAQGVEAKLARQALAIAEGNPGAALAWSRAGALALHAEIAKDLRELHAGLASAFEVAQRWSREDADLRLRFAASLAQHQARAQAQGGESMSAGGPLALTAGVDLAKLAGWFDKAGRTRDWLRGPLRPELALLELLRDWQAAAAPARTGKTMAGR